MRECCTVNNMHQATGDGYTSSQINVLVCKTCGYQATFTYPTVDPRNCQYSIDKYIKAREQLSLPVNSLSGQAQ